MRNKIILTAILYLGFVPPVYGDMVWPFMPMVQSNMMDKEVILAGLLIEYLFIRKITKFSIVKSIIVDLEINIFSAILGWILIILAKLPVESFIDFLMRTFHTQSGLLLIPILCVAVFINTLIESVLINTCFKYRMWWRGFWWLSLANAISVGVAAINIW